MKRNIMVYIALDFLIEQRECDAIFLFIYCYCASFFLDNARRQHRPYPTLEIYNRILS